MMILAARSLSVEVAGIRICRGLDLAVGEPLRAQHRPLRFGLDLRPVVEVLVQAHAQRASIRRLRTPRFNR